MSVSNGTYDLLLVRSNSLLCTSDDLVATLYPPQEPASVRDEVVALMAVVTELHNQLQVFFPVAEGVQEPASTRKKAGKKWFDTCFDQISKLSADLTSTSE